MHADNHGNRPYALIGQARMICLPFAPRPATTKAAPTKLYVCGQSNDTPHKETQLHSLNSDGECHSSQPASQPAINNNTFPERDTLLPPRSRKTFVGVCIHDRHRESASSTEHTTPFRDNVVNNNKPFLLVRGIEVLERFTTAHIKEHQSEQDTGVDGRGHHAAGYFTRVE